MRPGIQKSPAIRQGYIHFYKDAPYMERILVILKLPVEPLLA
jgi:hypothetical protein